MKNIIRNTDVVSVSLPSRVLKLLESSRQRTSQTRSAYIASLIEKEAQDARWMRIYARGAKTAEEFNITSEEDIERILNEN